MAQRNYRYVIIGAGSAGASAAIAIRERDPDGAVLLIGAEEHLPYDRPPLSKQLWSGAKTVSQIVLRERSFYDHEGITLALGTKAAGIDARHKTVVDVKGRRYRYDRLLLAAGGAPRRLAIPGGELEGICYFRTLDDYLRLRREAEPGLSAVVIGGGFIGSELAAALCMSKLDVTMIFPEATLCARVFPEGLGRAVQRSYHEHGVNVLSGDLPVAITRRRHRFLTRTRERHEIESDLLVVGIGIAPETGLARGAGLSVGDGVLVNERLETSRPGIYAAGDLANFPCAALDWRGRFEHWDNARAQGELAGRNMAGGKESYDHLPYFFSDLFTFGYEAVGRVNPALDVRTDWRKEYHTGSVYFMEEGKVRGALMCNIFGKLESARGLILKGAAAAVR